MIPDFQSMLLPLLKLIKDGKEYSINESIDTLGREYKLSDEELNEFLPSGGQKIFSNRVAWAKSYLKMSNLIEPTKRSHFKITQKGLAILNQNLDSIDVKFLKQNTDFQISTVEKKPVISLKEDFTPDTPEEQIGNGYQKIRNALEQDIISILKSVNPYRFEKIVVELLVKMGYGGSIQDAGKAIGKSGDEGIDGIIKEDKLGLDTIYIQAKRWEGIVGRPEIQKFVGALAGQRAKKGVFITTSSFTKEASAYALQMDTKIVLIDGETLAQYMIDYNLGVSVQNTYEIKKIDSDYFEEE
jgi:restriction system protein